MTPSSLPAITNTGENTFGCKINDDFWQPYVKRGIKVKQKPIEHYYADGMQRIEASLRYSRENHFYNQSIGLFFPVDTVGFFILGDSQNDSTPTYESYATFYDRDIGSFQSQDSLLSFIDVYRNDSIEKIISATFELHFYDSELGSIDITEGRFDIKYDSLPRDL